MANLFPIDSQHNIVTLAEIQKNKSVIFKESLDFDDETGDFVCDGQGCMTTASAIEAWKQWCKNCLDTARYSFASYSTDFGINKKLIFAVTDRESQELLIQTEITEALLADDYKRTKSVTDFEFNWITADTVEVTMTIISAYGATANITVEIGG